MCKGQKIPKLSVTYSVDYSTNVIPSDISTRPDWHRCGPVDVVVSEWGFVEKILFRPGDKLTLGEPKLGQLLVLVPIGRGAPMFGRWDGVEILAEPGGVPVSSKRWLVLGGVETISRSLERGAVASGEWFVAVSGVGGSSEGVPSLGAMCKPMCSLEIDRLCNSLIVKGLRCGMVASVGIASTLDEAQELANNASSGELLFSGTDGSAVVSSVVLGPWLRHLPEEKTKSVSRINSSSFVQLTMFNDSQYADERLQG